MNWEAIGAVGEILGAAGVIITLVYLTTQLRQNTQALRGTMHDAAAAQIREIQQVIIADREVARLWAEGFENPEGLERLDRARAMHLVYVLLSAC